MRGQELLHRVQMCFWAILGRCGQGRRPRALGLLHSISVSDKLCVYVCECVTVCVRVCVTLCVSGCEWVWFLGPQKAFGSPIVWCCPGQWLQEATCSDPILLRHRHRKAQLQKCSAAASWGTLVDIRHTLSDVWNHEPFTNYFTEHKSPACFSAPSKITLKSPSFPGQLHLPTGGYALYRCAEGLLGPHSVQSERERNYQRPEQWPLPGPNHLHTQHWEVAPANTRHLG